MEDFNALTNKIQKSRDKRQRELDSKFGGSPFATRNTSMKGRSQRRSE
jgi:hypothetical protein